MDPQAFALHRWRRLAYLREGAGGVPLLLLHGWPETKRIWWRNVEPLAQAGFEVIVPDMRGYGDSGLAPDGHYDVAAQARDMEALLREELRHQRCVVCGGDIGAGHFLQWERSDVLNSAIRRFCGGLLGQSAPG